MTHDIDIKGSKRTPFGIHGLPYGANKTRPIDISRTLQKAIKREFAFHESQLSLAEAKKAYNALSRKYSEVATKHFKQQSYTVVSYVSNYLGSDVRRVHDENVRTNFRITQRMLLLLAEAVRRKKGVVFR